MTAGMKPPGKPQMGSRRSRMGVKALANANEQDIANTLGGTRQPLSGALPGRKGDVETGTGIWGLDRFLFDSKETAGSSLLIDGKMLTKITREATGEMKEPGLVLTINKIPATTPKRWVAIPIETFVELLKIVRKES
jgi:hypothetical protein